MSTKHEWPPEGAQICKVCGIVAGEHIPQSESTSCIGALKRKFWAEFINTPNKEAMWKWIQRNIIRPSG
jgi:hypothetical protein